MSAVSWGPGRSRILPSARSPSWAKNNLQQLCQGINQVFKMRCWRMGRLDVQPQERKKKKCLGWKNSLKMKILSHFIEIVYVLTPSKIVFCFGLNVFIFDVLIYECVLFPMSSRRLDCPLAKVGVCRSSKRNPFGWTLEQFQSSAMNKRLGESRESLAMRTGKFKILIFP